MYQFELRITCKISLAEALPWYAMVVCNMNLFYANTVYIISTTTLFHWLSKLSHEILLIFLCNRLIPTCQNECYQMAWLGNKSMIWLTTSPWCSKGGNMQVCKQFSLHYNMTHGYFCCTISLQTDMMFALMLCVAGLPFFCNKKKKQKSYQSKYSLSDGWIN